MKTLKVIGIILVAGIVFSACETAQTPEKVAEDFLNYLEVSDYDNAKTLGTANTHEILENLKAFEQMEGFGDFEEAEPRVISNVECDVADDFARCTYLADDEQGELDLVKEDDLWLVDMQKETPMDDITFESDDDYDWEEDSWEEAEEEVEEEVEEVIEE